MTLPPQGTPGDPTGAMPNQSAPQAPLPPAGMTPPQQGTPVNPPAVMPGTPQAPLPQGQALPGMSQPSALPGMGQAAGQFAGAMAQNVGSNIVQRAQALNPLAIQNGIVGGLLAHIPLVICGLLWMGYNAFGGKTLYSLFHFGALTGLGSPKPSFFDFVLGMYAPLGLSIKGGISADIADKADISASLSIATQPLFATLLVIIALYFIGKKVGERLPLASWKDVATSAVASWLIFIVLAVVLGLLSKVGNGSEDSFESSRFGDFNIGLGIGRVVLVSLVIAVLPLMLGALRSSTLRIAWVRRTWTYNLVQSLRSLVFTVFLSAVLFVLLVLGIGIFYLIKYGDYAQMLFDADGGVIALIVATLVGILLIVPQVGATVFLARTSWAPGLKASGKGFEDGDGWLKEVDSFLTFANPTKWWYATLILLVLIILIAGIHLFIKRPNARIEGAGFNAAAYAAYAILLMMIPVFVMTTSYGKEHMSVRLGVSGVAILTFAILGLLVDLCARYVAPYVIQAVPFLAGRYAKSYTSFMETYGAFLAPGSILSEEEIQRARAERAQRIAEQTAAAKEKMAAQQAAAQAAAEQQRAQYAAQQAQFAAQQAQAPNATPPAPAAPSAPATPQAQMPNTAAPAPSPAEPAQPVSNAGTANNGQEPPSSMPTPPPPPPGA